MYLVGKVLYSQIHSLMPREASLVTILGERVFEDYNAAIEYCRGLKIAGDYTFVPVEVGESLFSGFGKSNKGKEKGRTKGKRK